MSGVSTIGTPVSRSHHQRDDEDSKAAAIQAAEEAIFIVCVVIAVGVVLVSLAVAYAIYLWTN